MARAIEARVVLVQSLAHEQTREPQVGLILADLVGLAAGQARHPQGVVKTEALIDFAVDPRFGASPEPRTQVQRGIGCLRAVAGRQAVGPRIGRIEVRRLLFYVSELTVDGEGLCNGCVGNRFRGGGDRSRGYGRDEKNRSSESER